MFWENIVNNDSCNILKDKVSSQSLCPHPVPNEFLVFIKVEDDVKVETDTLYDINWRAYARNLKTSEIIEFDKDKGIKVDPSAVYVKVEPY